MRFLVKGDWVANINLSPNGSFLRLIRMIESLLGLIVLLGLIAVGMLFVLLRRQVVVDLSPVVARLETLEKLQERGERGMKEEVARSRGESGEQARGLREELHRLLTNSNEVLTSSVDRISRVQKEKLDAFSTSLEKRNLMHFRLRWSD
jgi:hypothetical protein